MSRAKADLIVIGAGLAGMAAAGFAARKGLQTIVVGSTTASLLFASGLLDLLGIYPTAHQTQWEAPWAGIAELIRGSPQHPYARVGIDAIRTAVEQFLEILAKAGLSYCGWPERNAKVATSVGTVKPTYRVPETMWPGVVGLAEKTPALLLDFEGMKDFSAQQMVATLKPHWPGLRAFRLQFPCDFQGVDRYSLNMAQALDSSEVQSALATTIRPVLKDAQLVGMPAVLGLRRPDLVAAELAGQLSVPVFEIPGMPPSVPGLRLKQALEQSLQQAGVELLVHERAVAVNVDQRHCASVVVEGALKRKTLYARGVLLATGRYLGGGLVADRSGIREPLLGLPVHQPASREEWHHLQFLDLRGHPVNQAGLVVDDLLRPLGAEGCCAYENLFAAGSVLAHQDWMRMKCGAGLAIATAWGAVNAFNAST